MSKYGVLSGPYFPVFGLNTGKYGPEKTSYLDTFHAVSVNTTYIEKFQNSFSLSSGNCDYFVEVDILIVVVMYECLTN